MNLNQFKIKFSEIQNMGFIESARRGPTGIGKTLENLLGIKENNIALPDLGSVELKAHRIDSTSMITLFTFNRKAWIMNPLEAIRKYGTKDESGRLGLYFTMSRMPNCSELFLHIDKESVSVRHVSGETVAKWNLQDLQQQFVKKIPALILVSAQAEDRAGKEWFNFRRAQLLTGVSSDNLGDQIVQGNVLIDLRLHDKETSARNHGTGFRTTLSKLPLLFRNIVDL